jgi:hypothetical protein
MLTVAFTCLWLACITWVGHDVALFSLAPVGLFLYVVGDRLKRDGLAAFGAIVFAVGFLLPLVFRIHAIMH